MKSKFFSILALAMILGCGNDDEQLDNNRITYMYGFSEDTEGWNGDFADYPAGEEENYGLEFEHSPLPDPLDNSQGSLKLSGKNHSDDLFMFVKKQVTGLTPNQEYRLNFEVEFASNVADGQFGIGGSPGESVYIKAGAAPMEPEKEEDELGWYRLNIDKGNQATSGENMVVIGSFANGSDENIYTLKSLSPSTPMRVTANSEGSLWLLFGVDSGFEGETTIYINRIDVELF
ncbi:hypothetical protein LB467_15745 [Salegentibacter sp. JZCK2]|uniref:hypothetical protein n=1 Tax=Salegentibacter tibetensis TaxID=2873600 RepID=UPI001CCCAAAF|nr:hypothetical protein [Salegentibacter tibetensis]MBZ9731148.1 hypothetical protein [Salegentibacter tibetensis]